jgi:hypothetical protein
MRFFALLALAATAAAAPRGFSSDSSLVTRQTPNLPSNLKWTSSDILVKPKNDSRNIAGIKDPSIVFYKNAYHVFASTAKGEGYNLLENQFVDIT